MGSERITATPLSPPLSPPQIATSERPAEEGSTEISHPPVSKISTSETYTPFEEPHIEAAHRTREQEFYRGLPINRDSDGPVGVAKPFTRTPQYRPSPQFPPGYPHHFGNTNVR